MKIVFAGTFDGVSVSKDGIVRLKFRAPLSEIAEAIKYVMMIDRQIKAALKVDDEEGKAIKIGSASYYSIRVDRHGESRLELETDISTLAAQTEDFRAMVNKPVSVALAIKDSSE